MVLYSEWSLEPQFQIEFLEQQHFQERAEQEGYLKIDVVLQKDSQNIAPNPNLFVISHPLPKKLSYEAPGNSHISSSMGANLAAHLLSQLFSSDKIAGFCLNLSEGVLQLIQHEQCDFLLAILQRSVSNRVKKSSSILKTKSIIFEENLFSKDTLNRAYTLSRAMSFTRTLINMPANVLNPETYETFLLDKISREKNPLIKTEILSAEKLETEGCGLISAVGKGSSVPPRIIKLMYCPHDHSHKELKHVTLVGKGITFDSGGYDLKPPNGMRMMKKDMGGSAAVCGIFFACAQLHLPVQLTCYLAIAENMVSGNAMRPGDIYTARNKLNVEIDNTDAEGRLVLADAIALACEENPDWLIDIATLTGAARVSMGPMVDCLFSNQQQTQDLLYKTGIETGDWVWPCPLPADYEPYFDSSIADFMNSGSSGFAGAITAALFLQKFVTVEKWSHIDSYMWCDKPNGLWHEGSAPTAKCVRLVTRAIEIFASA